MSQNPLARWHQLIESRDPRGLDDLLANEVVFHSPILHTPQSGKALTKMYLLAAFRVLANPSFRYVREVVGSNEAVLEFECEVDGLRINGVDMLHWNAAGLIDDFKVMVRPLKAMQVLQQKMAELLQAGAKAPAAR